MKVLAINGSPRKTWNTAILVNKALEGAASEGAETEIIHLYDLNYKGCISCFECKKKNGKNYGKCAVKDELTPILSKIEEVDAMIIGTPNYLGMPTGMMKAFLERFMFPYIVYETNYPTLFNRKISIGFIYTMGANEARMEEMGYDKTALFIEKVMKMIYRDETIRYNKLKSKLPSIAHKTLSLQLKELEDNGLINRKQYQQVPPKVEYSLSEKGKSLIPILTLMAQWGEENM